MQLAPAIKLFSAQPWACVFLTVLFVLKGMALPAGWVPPSSIRRYFPGHEWVMAGICCVVAGFFVYCTVVGWRSQNDEANE